MVEKKGFTLVELMGVLIIIGILGLIIIPVTSSIIKDQRQKQYEQQVVNIELAAKNLGSDNLLILPEIDGEYMYLTLGQLKSMGYMEGSIINPVSKEEISDCARIRVTKTGNIYSYEYDKTTEKETNCSSGNNNIMITSPIKQYIKKGDKSSYIITINNNNTNQILNKYIIDKEKVKLTGTTDATYSIIEGNGMYKIIIRGGLEEGEISLRLESGAILKNDIEDLVGAEGLESSDKIIVDNTIPTITFGTNGNSNWAKTASSTISVSDNLSGGNTDSYKYVYSTYDSTPSLAFNSGSTYSQTTGSGYYYLIASACDRSGNCTTSTSNVFKLDNEAPNCGTWNGQNSSWTNSNVTITMTGIDDNSGIKEGNGFSKTYSSGTIKTEIVNYTVEDALGNTRECSSTVNVYVDKEAPSCNWSGEGTTWTNDNRIITLTGIDSGSGMKTESETKSWTYDSGTTSTAYLSYTVSDNVGNTTFCSKNADIYVDKDAPTIECVNDNAVAYQDTTPITITPGETCNVYGTFQDIPATVNMETEKIFSVSGQNSTSISRNYCDDSGECQNPNWKRTDGRCITGYCYAKITMTARDEAGNSASKDFTYYFKY